MSVSQHSCAEASRPIARSIFPSARGGSTVDPLELYAAAIDTSDYVRSVVPIIRQHVPTIGDLLDVGAGGGQIGRALHAPGSQWTAVEPSATMCARLARSEPRPSPIVALGWEAADIPIHAHDTVLAASVGASLQQTDAFLARCRAWARRTVVWVVHAQRGPHGLILAGCLPDAWHGEDETPGVDIVLRNLAPAARPHVTVLVDWTFTAVIADLDQVAGCLADRLGWSRADGRRPQMADHLASQAKNDPAGYRLEIPRKSAVLVWGSPWVGNSVASR